MHRDTAQEGDLAVDDDLRAIGRDGAESDRVGDLVIATAPLDVVQTGPAGVPPLGLDVEFEGARDLDVDVELRNPQAHRQIVAVDLDSPDDAAVRCHREPGMAEECRRCRDQVDRPGEAAEVPPIGAHRGDPIPLASIVDLDDEGMLAGTKTSGEFDCVRAEASDMGGQLDTIEEDSAGVIGRADVKEQPPFVELASGHGDLTAIPDGAFVVVESIVLSVPVAGNGQRRRRVEVVLDPVTGMAWRVVAKEPAIVALFGNPDVAHLVRVDDDVPLAVERGAAALQDVRKRAGADVHGKIVAGRASRSFSRCDSGSSIRPCATAAAAVGPRRVR